jgi:hypothetical protein
MTFYWTEHYWVVNDDRSPKLIHHSNICYPLPYFQQKIDMCDTSYPGIVTQYDKNTYHLNDGLHRIAKLQEQGIYESLFYIVYPEEHRDGILSLVDTQSNQKRKIVEDEPPDNFNPISLKKENEKWIEEYGYKTMIVDVLPHFPIKITQNSCRLRPPPPP